MNVPISGVYVANPGYMLGVAGIPRGAVLTELDGKPLASLDDALAIFATLGHGQRATVRYFTMEDTRTLQLTSIRIDRAWFPARHCVRDDAAGTLALHADCGGTGCAAAAARHDGLHAHRRQAGGRILRRRWCWSSSTCRTRSPASPSAITTAPASCSTPVRGLVAVDRNTVPVSLGDVRLTFAGTIQVDGDGRVRAPAAQPRRGPLRPEAARRDAGQGREVRDPHARDRRDRCTSSACRATTAWRRSRRPWPRSGRSGSRCRARCSSATPTSRSCGW